MAIYLEKLSKFGPDVIKGAISLTIEQWDKPNMLPPVGYVLKRIDEHDQGMRTRHLEQHTQRLLQREDGTKEQISNAEIRGWLEEGKGKQLARIEELNANPEWERMARALGTFPTGRVGSRQHPTFKEPSDITNAAVLDTNPVIREIQRVMCRAPRDEAQAAAAHEGSWNETTATAKWETGSEPFEFERKENDHASHSHTYWPRSRGTS
jgi:hypothetical protein